LGGRRAYSYVLYAQVTTTRIAVTERTTDCVVELAILITLIIVRTFSHTWLPYASHIRSDEPCWCWWGWWRISMQATYDRMNHIHQGQTFSNLYQATLSCSYGTVTEKFSWVRLNPHKAMLSCSYGRVTAPISAPVTKRAYLASTPLE